MYLKFYFFSNIKNGGESKVSHLLKFTQYRILSPQLLKILTVTPLYILKLSERELCKNAKKKRFTAV